MPRGSHRAAEVDHRVHEHRERARDSTHAITRSACCAISSTSIVSATSARIASAERTDTSTWGERADDLLTGLTLTGPGTGDPPDASVIARTIST